MRAIQTRHGAAIASARAEVENTSEAYRGQFRAPVVDDYPRKSVVATRRIRTL